MSVNYQGHRAARTKPGIWQGEASAKPFYPPAQPISERQKALWQGLNQYVIERGAALTTIPNIFPARLETHPDSPLPAKLRELGWDVVFREKQTRLGPQIETHDAKGREKPKPSFGNSYGFHTVDVYDIALPPR